MNVKYTQRNLSKCVQLLNRILDAGNHALYIFASVTWGRQGRGRIDGLAEESLVDLAAREVPGVPPCRSGSQVSTRILGRRTAPFFAIPYS